MHLRIGETTASFRCDAGHARLMRQRERKRFVPHTYRMSIQGGTGVAVLASKRDALGTMPIVRMQIVQRPITFPVELAVQGLVEVPVKENAQIIWNPGHNQKLYQYVVAEGRPFFIVGRNSE